MIKLYQFPPLWHLPNASLFCMKLETYLRMTKIPYESVYVGNPGKAPKGKLPYIIDENKTIADSHFIIEYLKNKHGDILDAHLTPREKGIALAIQQLAEEHLYWIVMYTRWQDEDFWPQTRKAFFGHINKLLRTIIAHKVRKHILQQLHSQGTRRHSRDEIYQRGTEATDALSALLGNQDYILGPTPTSIDAGVYALIQNVLVPPLETPLKQHTQQSNNLVNYCERMTQHFYG